MHTMFLPWVPLNADFPRNSGADHLSHIEVHFLSMLVMYVRLLLLLRFYYVFVLLYNDNNIR